MGDWGEEGAEPLLAAPSAYAAPLAYKDAEFLDSQDGRPLRILAEYAEPLARFRHERIEDTVVFFGSARVAPRQDHRDATEPQRLAGIEMSGIYEDARTLARTHALWARTLPGPRHRFVVTSGGGPGIMEAANRGAWEAGAKTIGLNIKLPFEQRPNRYITPELNFNFHYFFMRKYWFAYLAKALVVFPGGFGTMDEMFEILTLAQTQKLAKHITILLYGTAYWKSVLNFDFLAEHGLISPADLGLFQYADTPEAAFAILQTGLTEHHLEAAEAGERTPVPAEPAPSAQQALGPDISPTR